MVAGSNKQQGAVHKHKETLPVAAQESVLFMVTNYTEEGGDVATVDMPNAFIQTKIDDDNEVIVSLRGRLAELLAKLAPVVCHKHVTIDDEGQTALCV